METIGVEMPWKHAEDATACNFALGHLVQNLPRRLTIDGRLHAETYLAAAGAIAGFAAQQTLFADSQTAVVGDMQRASTTSGEQYWFGEPLNRMLIGSTEQDRNRCAWPIAQGGAFQAGVTIDDMPDVRLMFEYVASTIGQPNEGRSSVHARHQASLPARELLKAVWPLALTCISGRFPGAAQEYGAAPVLWWASLAAWATSRPIQDVKGVMPPAIGLTLLMETAIYCSKLDRLQIEAD